MRFHEDRRQFPSRRSTVMAPKGIVATSQPLASQAGLSVLKAGGNAVDAAISSAAVLNIVEPGSTGIGGDVFAIIYDSESRSLLGLNSSGWSPRNATIERYRRLGFDQMPSYGVFSITIPGALAGWEALLQRFGRLSLREVLKPAISYARNGYPVSERIAHAWREVAEKLSRQPGGRSYLVNNKAPRPGQVFRQKKLASTLEAIAEGGAEVFYKGELSRRITGFLRDKGGIIENDDLSEFEPEWVDPLSVDYRGHTIYELPPNCQGLCALEALKITSNFPLAETELNSSQYLHTLIESMKLAFADGHRVITDPKFREIPVQRLLSDEHCTRRGNMISDEAINGGILSTPGSDTVYLSVVDENRNMASFINSLYHGFGSGVVVKGTGIILQNRGASFTLEDSHSNCLEPRKRPYHTIIPALAYKDGVPYMSFGVMGGHMQPQGHLQVASNIINFQMTPQDALDAPRFQYLQGRSVLVEDSVSLKVIGELRDRGHLIKAKPRFSRVFGGGQIIVLNTEEDCLYAGSDPRKDGCATGY